MPTNLGIYFGIRTIDIIRSKGTKIINAIHIPHDKIYGADLEEKVPEDVKIVALIKDELRKQKLEAKEVGVALSGKDLIIRSFELPFLPTRELFGAINFEAKKYIPFKTEDIIFDFQLKPDRKEKKNLIIFLGIKKETIQNYLSIMKQLELKVTSLEYSAFSILRLMALINLKVSGVYALVDIDLEDETNFMILEDGFPLFCLDIDLSSLAGADIESLSERLKGEIQLSSDYYYHRRFFSKKIDSMIIFGSQDYKNIISSWGQDVGLSCQFVDMSQYIAKGRQISLSTSKALSVSLASSKKMPLRFELIYNWERSRVSKVSVAQELEKALSLKELRPDVKFVVLGIFIVIFSFALGLYQGLPFKKQLTILMNTRPKLITVLDDKSYEDLKAIDSNYNDKITVVNKLLSRYPYFTQELNALPKCLPKGVWLTAFRFTLDDAGKELLLKGSAYLRDSNKEFEAVATLFSNLKKDPEFLRTFKFIEIALIERGKIEKWEVTNFVISCKD